MSRTDRHASSRYRGIYWYATADGKRWGAVVDADPDWRSGRRRQIRKHGFRTQDEARSWQVAFQDKRRRGETVEPSLTPLGVWMEEWLAGRVDIAPATRRIYAVHFGWLAPLHSTPISRLRPQEIERELARLVREGHRPSSVANCKRTLSTCLRGAVRLGLLASNPCAQATAPAGERRKPTALTIAEANRLIATAREQDDAWWATLWRFAIETGLRIGELIELRWSDVDLAAGVVAVARSQVEGDRHGTWQASTPKTPNSIRAVPISPDLVSVMRRHRVMLIERGMRAGRTWTDETLVFPDENGRWLRRVRIQRQLERACQRAGVPRLTPHGLRHTSGSIAYVSGVDLKTISERMGHKDVMTTIRIYVHTDAGHHRRVADTIGGLFADGNRADQTGS